MSSALSPVSEGFVEVPGARLFCRTLGAGTPLLVLHGGPDFDHSYFLPELDRLGDLARLVSYDQRGRGRSAEGVTPGDVTIDSEVEDLDRLRQHFGLETLRLLGHSWGCVLAMEYAARHPGRTNRVALMNPAPASHRGLLRFREHRQATEPDTLARMREIAGTPIYLQGDIEVEAEYYRLHYQRAVARPELVDAIVRRLRVHYTPEGIVKARAIEDRLYEQTWLRSGYDLLERWHRFTGPALVIHGANDFVPKECSEEIVGASVSGRLAVIQACGHFSYLEQPERVHDELARFLGS